MNNGAREPLFGAATGAMKPLAKQTGKNQALAEELYATGNYDAMYFAGMIACSSTFLVARYLQEPAGCVVYILNSGKLRMICSPRKRRIRKTR
jgi:hypothetical protein